MLAVPSSTKSMAAEACLAAALNFAQLSEPPEPPEPGPVVKPPPAPPALVTLPPPPPPPTPVEPVGFAPVAEHPKLVRIVSESVKPSPRCQSLIRASCLRKADL